MGDAVHETPEDIRALQDLLDRSYKAAGAHLRSITTPERRVGAEDLVERLTGMCLLVVATVTADCRPIAGPLIAVRLWILTRKTLGGLETDLSARVLRGGGEPLSGLYAAGEVAGFGGGGVHGYRSLEGTFLGGCLFSGRTAGRAVAQAVA